jgi:DNA-binding MarR family transcriptional regulator
MREDKIRQISDDLLIIPPIIGKSINNILLKSVFAAIKDDISPPHFAIMKVLNDNGGAHMSEVADWLQFPRSQMTHMADKLEKLGYVARLDDPADRRSIKIELTESGKRVFQEWVQTVRCGTGAILNYLTDEELNDLADSLSKLRDIIIKIVRNHYQYETGRATTEN